MTDAQSLLAEAVELLDDAAETLSVASTGEAFHPRLRPSVLRRHIEEIHALVRRAKPFLPEKT